MKREIKFRAWIPNVGWLADGFSISMDGTEWYDDNSHSWPLSDIELMQFTGLHDKNGKEIYEGDIITYRWEDRKGDEVVNHVIKWDNGRFLICPIRSTVQTWNIHLYPYNEESEVIGNIYENPEQLNP